MSAAVVHRVTVHPLSIPLRQKVTHAASAREAAEPVVVAVELRDGTVGYGETLPRTYVTGETVESVVQAIQSTFVPALLTFHPESFAEALEAIEGLPWTDADDRPAPAARAAVELALLDGVLRSYRREIESVVQWMGLPGFGSPGSLRTIRFSGVLASQGRRSTLRQLRLMYWGGLRHFKLKVGMSGDQELVRAVAAYLRRAIACGRATLRVDANGTWSPEDAIEWMRATADLPIAGIEQPLRRGDEAALPQLLRPHGLKPAARMMTHDESLVTIEDARRLVELGVADGFNIRISKCGGLIPSLRIAALARRENVRIQLGCMVGETSILSAAGLRFLEVCPNVEWAEGCFGSFLLAGDVAKRSLRFGFGGRPPRLSARGLGVEVDPALLTRYLAGDSIVINL